MSSLLLLRLFDEPTAVALALTAIVGVWNDRSSTTSESDDTNDDDSTFDIDGDEPSSSNDEIDDVDDVDDD